MDEGRSLKGPRVPVRDVRARGTALQQHGLPCQPVHRQAGDVLDEGEVRLGAFQRIAEEDRQGHMAPIGQAEKGQIVVRKLESLGRPVGRAGLVSGGQAPAAGPQGSCRAGRASRP